MDGTSETTGNNAAPAANVAEHITGNSTGIMPAIFATIGGILKPLAGISTARHEL